MSISGASPPRPVVNAQGSDRDRAGVVRVVLVDLPGVEQPHPGSELGLHVQHALACGDQLLSEQMTQAAGTLNSPAALGPALRPVE